VPDRDVYLNPLDGHEYAHRWYDFQTIFLKDAAGFYWSPFLNGPRIAQGGKALGDRARPAMAGEPDLPLTGFERFGSVGTNGGLYTLTEAADAGIFKTLVLPVGVQLLKFRYRYATPGDGDFLTVHWGDSPPLYIGSDVLLAREGFVDAEIDIAGLAGLTNTLVFTLTSRGETNAVLLLEDLALTVSDDPDGDGLTTLQEAGLGTDPLLADTDGDGLLDGAESDQYLTNPLQADSDADGARDGVEVLAGTDPTDPDSCLEVLQTEGANGGAVTLIWSAQTGRTYRINRRAALTDSGYDTLATGIPGVAPETAYTVEALPAAPAAFYWVEVE
jgi:hypothetical protein